VERAQSLEPHRGLILTYLTHLVEGLLLWFFRLSSFSLRTRWLIELLFPFLCYVGLVGLSKRGYNAKKRSEATLITAQNGMFSSIIDVVSLPIQLLWHLGALVVVWRRLTFFRFIILLLIVSFRC
jgi:hypothetical protein